jgi:hypothetical protein
LRTHRSAQTSATHVIPAGHTTINKVIGKDRIQIEIASHSVDIGKASDPRPTEINSNCTYSVIPCSIVDSLKIEVDGVSLFVPRSVFSDLADVSSATMRANANGFLLKLTGGDASESYFLAVYFTRRVITERRLYSNLDSSKPLQVTKYFATTLD